MAKGLYDIIHRAMTWPEPFISLGLPPPKRYMWVPTTTVSHLTAQETEAAALGKLEQGALPYLSPTPRGWYTHWDDTPTCQCGRHPLHLLLPGWGVPEGPSIFHATIFAYVCNAYLGTKLLCPLCPIMLFNTNTLKWHSKWGHHPGSLDPT